MLDKEIKERLAAVEMAGGFCTRSEVEDLLMAFAKLMGQEIQWLEGRITELEVEL